MNTTQPTPKSLPQPLPHFTVSVLPYDPETQLAALIYRGENVRSAKNCLSIPSGLLEHGESFAVGILRELEEELGIPADACSNLQFHTIYRNIMGDGFDWVIGIWTVEVQGLGGLTQNREPDKHDYIMHVRLAELSGMVNSPMEIEDKIFAPNLRANLRPVVDSLLK